jgi:hypothetical protein
MCNNLYQKIVPFVRKCGKIWERQRESIQLSMLSSSDYRNKFKICNNFFLFHRKNGYANASQCYVYTYILISTLHPRLRISSGLLQSHISTKILLFHSCSVPCPSHAACFDNPNNACEEQKSPWNSSLCRLLRFPVTSLSEGQIFFSAPSYWKPSTCPSFNVRPFVISI